MDERDIDSKIRREVYALREELTSHIRTVQREQDTDANQLRSELADLHDRMRALEEVVAGLTDKLDQHIEDEDEAHRGLVPGITTDEQ